MMIVFFGDALFVFFLKKPPAELSDIIRQTSYDIHVYLGHVHMEKVYENALANRLRNAGLDVRQQYPLKVYDVDGSEIGDYMADLLIEESMIVELKAARTIAPEHIAQILGYLRASRLEHGLLINFGSYKFELRKFIKNSPAISATKNTEITKKI